MTYMRWMIPVFAYLPTFALSHVLKDELPSLSVSNSVLSLFLFIGLYMLIRFAFSHANYRAAVLSSFTGLLFSVFMVLGKNVSITRETHIFTAEAWIHIICLTPMFSAAVLCILTLNPQALQPNACDKDKRVFSGLLDRFSAKQRFFVIWLFLFIAWLPWFLAAYPGIYAYDSVYQINYYRSGQLLTKHPVIHSSILGFCVITLGNLLGSPEAGMCIYSILQMLILSAIYAVLEVCLIEKYLSKPLHILTILLFAFIPLHAFMGISSTKDVLFSAFFALSVMFLLLAAEKPSRLDAFRFRIALTLALFFMIIFRSQGIYVFLFGSVFAYAVFSGRRKKWLSIVASCLLLFVLYSGPVSTLLGGTKWSALHEMMSVPCVQLSRARLECEDELTKEEEALIEAYIPKYEAYSFNAGISDLMKNRLDTSRIKANPAEFIKLWAGVGLKCPVVYIDAFARLTVGFWYPDMNYRDPEAFHPYWEYYSSGRLEYLDRNKYLVLDQTPAPGFEPLNDFAYRLTYHNSYQRFPVISMLFSSGFTTWLLLLFIVMCIYHKQFKYLVPASFAFGLLLTLLLGPVVLFRYVYPLYLTVPLFAAAAVHFKQKNP